MALTSQHIEIRKTGNGYTEVCLWTTLSIIIFLKCDALYPSNFQGILILKSKSLEDWKELGQNTHHNEPRGKDNDIEAMLLALTCVHHQHL